MGVDSDIWEEDYYPDKEKADPILRTDELDEDAMRDEYEHLMSGSGWSRLHIEIPALRTKDFDNGGFKEGGWKEYEGRVTTEIAARRMLKKQEMMVSSINDKANLVSSQCTDGFHRLCIDVDRKCEVLVSDFADAIIVVQPYNSEKYEKGKWERTPRPTRPVALSGNLFKVDSSAVDHCHVYSDHPYTWGEYAQVLKQLGMAGVIQKSYYLYSVERGFTAVRKPWVRKLGTPPPPKHEDMDF
jgi:hypothetical protein